jgi:16S rRNA C967 or C1407 C5-methylase (RsmB/RsmF family)
MMAEASKLLQKLSQRLFEDTAEQKRFINSLTHPEPLASAITWTHPRPAEPLFPVQPALSWQADCIDRIAPEIKPGRHPLHNSGAYYCLDMSSVFAASVLSAIPQPIDCLLDLCAAPGGKSILAQQLLQPRQLLCNETIRKRIKILISNLKRCQIKTATVLNLDPSTIAEHIPHSIPVILVDAPCSGQSLLAKGEKAEGCFHPIILKKNAQRQKRILSHAAEILARGGYLAYMTCTYALEENEQVIQWFLKKFPHFNAIPVNTLAAHQSHLAPDLPCYRLWPQDGIGAGSFTTLLHKADDFSPGKFNPENAIQPFIDQFGIELFW